MAVVWSAVCAHEQPSVVRVLFTVNRHVISWRYREPCSRQHTTAQMPSNRRAFTIVTTPVLCFSLSCCCGVCS